MPPGWVTQTMEFRACFRLGKTTHDWEWFIHVYTTYKNDDLGDGLFLL
jgi:hypothetical protein